MELLLKGVFVLGALISGIVLLWAAFRAIVRGESATEYGILYYAGGVSLVIGVLFGLMLLGDWQRIA